MSQRSKPTRLIAARNEARSIVWKLTRELPAALWKWVRIEWTVWKALRKL